MGAWVRKIGKEWVEDLPFVSELKDCRQLSKDEWEGTDVADGTVYRVKGPGSENIAPIR
jgi:hypothetical protein